MGPSLGAEIGLPAEDLKPPLFYPKDMEVSRVPWQAMG